MRTILISDVKLMDKPKVSLTIMRVESSVWNDFNFARYHYMSADINKSCKCFLIKINGIPAGFFGMISQTGCGIPKHAYRSSRQVILPDFQGLGVSLRIREFIAGVWCSGGDDYVFYTTTIHPRVGEAMKKSNNWCPTIHNGKERKGDISEDKKARNRLRRKSYCYRYCGKPIYGYDELMKSIGDLRDAKMKNQSYWNCEGSLF